METCATGDNLLASAGYYVPPLGASDGAVAAGGGCAGSLGAFDLDDNKVVRCGLMFGNVWLSCADTAVDLDDVDGVIYATVTHNGGSGAPKLSVHKGTSLPESTLDATHRLLYEAVGGTDGGAWADYRSCILVPVLS